MATKSETLKNITEEYLSKIDRMNPPTPADIQTAILNAVTLQFQLENTGRASGSKWSIPISLQPAQIATILLSLYPIVKLSFAGLDRDEEYDVLALYQSDGENKGIYVINEKAFHRLIRQYNYEISRAGLNEVMSVLNENAPRRERCKDRDLVAVNNGIFDYKNKMLLPFNPELIFTSKARVNYNVLAQNLIIHNDDDGTDWDFDSWLDEVANHDPELTQLLWELIGASLRPNVPWNKSAWFLSERGNNGKGTLCSLIRNVLGKGSHTSIKLDQFGKDFMLEPLIKACAIITDENPVGSYLEDASNLKAIITGDSFKTDRKYKTPVELCFRGLVIQCVNEMPRVRDRSESFLRRLLLIPFMQCFTGRERKYIKEDYLKRPEVLEYVLFKVLNMDYYELSEPTVCKQTLAEFRIGNDPVAQFVEEMLPQSQWDFIPYSFLYALYLAWFKENCAGNYNYRLGSKPFNREVRRILETSDEWRALGPTETRKVGNRMNNAEPLIQRYDLKKWFNPTYFGSDPEKLCHPAIPQGGVRGIERRR